MNTKPEPGAGSGKEHRDLSVRAGLGGRASLNIVLSALLLIL